VRAHWPTQAFVCNPGAGATKYDAINRRARATAEKR
jgi:hypothetical protein